MWKLEGALVGMHLLQTTFHPCCPLEGSPSSRPKNFCSVHLFCQNGFLCVGLRPVLTDGSHSFILRLMQFFSTTSYSTGCSHGCCPETAHAKKVGLQTGPRSRAQEVKSLLLHSLLFTWGIMVTQKCYEIYPNIRHTSLKLRGAEKKLVFKPCIPRNSHIPNLLECTYNGFT